MEERIPTSIPQPEGLQQGPASAPAEDAAVAVSVSSGEDSSDEEGGSEFEFEFPFLSRDAPAGTADELFADGRIRPFYPVFGRVGGCAAPAAAAVEPRVRVRGQLGRLFLEETRERNSSTSSTSTASTTSSSGGATDDDGDLEGAAPESYCVWRPGGGGGSAPAPRPRPPRKSGSTGSMARWRRISDLVVGRSHSDGKEKFVFLAAASAPAPHEEADSPAAAAAAASSKDGKPTRPRPRTPPPPPGAGGRKPPHAIPPGGTPRRTFLPYREELVGFFANVNGVSRSHQHPF